MYGVGWKFLDDASTTRHDIKNCSSTHATFLTLPKVRKKTARKKDKAFNGTLPLKVWVFRSLDVHINWLITFYFVSCCCFYSFLQANVCNPKSALPSRPSAHFFRLRNSLGCHGPVRTATQSNNLHRSVIIHGTKISLTARRRGPKQKMSARFRGDDLARQPPPIRQRRNNRFCVLLEGSWVRRRNV